ncbi:MAG TPA: alpha-2-macroglobulin family protein, partial [Fibrobacteria bacterium]|nr:alpha-2-macroglobulin family protein [Fibrobacteria bacterium]
SFYTFVTTTDADGPTGNYRVRVKAGPAVFEEKLKVETVVPNRIKIRADVNPKPLTRGTPLRGTLEANWLSGPIAKGLDADMELTLTSVKPDFKVFTDYEFSDPSRVFDPETQILFSGKLDGNGKASFSKTIDVTGTAPGFLRASFRSRVREVSGAASIDRFAENFHAYSAYVGLRLPQGDQARGMLLTDTTHRVRLAALTPTGQRVPRRTVEVQLYKLDWRWWWEKDDREATSLVDESRNALQRDTVTLTNGEGTWGLMVHYPEWGRYLLRVCDLDGGATAHCAGRIFYMDWPGWAGRARSEGAGGGAAILPFTSDKTQYNVGQPVRLTLPSPEGGRALISIEKGDRILKRYWIDLKEKQTVHEFIATADMAPNVYVHVTLLQPYARAVNDRPIRLYNVLPIRVENPATHLSPRLGVAPSVFRPGEKATITVSEAQGRPMDYVVAVVDEGLLDLTRFKTPDPWERFYAREALGVKTWDMFDYVAGSQGGNFERVLAIGGDEGVRVVDGARGNRFPPMVRFFGPFSLEKGREGRHEFTVPQYVGSVRVMVVAGRDGAYGRAEKAVPVRKPLMVLGALPRALAPGESVELPVSVFATEPSVKEANVEVSISGPLQLAGGGSAKVSFTEPSDKLVSFPLKTRDAVGWAHTTIRARSGDQVAEQTMDIEVRNPNERVVDVLDTVLEAGASWVLPFRFTGVSGTNRATLEFSRIPPLNLSRRLNYLIQYPHGCAEQTTSAAFPQLYLEGLTTLTSGQKTDVERNVKAAIQKLRGFQAPSGGFMLWPDGGVEQPWVSNYVGHFLVEAEKKGFAVEGMLEPWRKYQRGAALDWRESSRYGDQLTQAYRLYTLALAGYPEQGAMNRMREIRELALPARWQLGAAYQAAGQSEIAATLVQGRPAFKPYSEQDGTFGSDLRDRAMMLDVLVSLDRKAEAAGLFKEISASLARPYEWSTQSTAYALMAAGRYAGASLQRGVPSAYAFSFNGGPVESDKLEAPLLRRSLKIDAWDNTLKFWNKGGEPIYASVLVEGQPALGEETAAARGIALGVRFTDLKGKPIDPSTLEQGTDFFAEYSVRQPGGMPYKQLALTTVFASGWEIRNTRLDPVEGMAAEGSFTHQDFRDDRVYTYFNLGAGEEKVFRFLLNASYLGTYHLPQAVVKVMYDPGLSARAGGREVKVVPGKALAR